MSPRPSATRTRRPSSHFLTSAFPAPEVLPSTGVNSQRAQDGGLEETLPWSALFSQQGSRIPGAAKISVQLLYLAGFLFCVQGPVSRDDSVYVQSGLGVASPTTGFWRFNVPARLGLTSWSDLQLRARPRRCRPCYHLGCFYMNMSFICDYGSVLPAFVKEWADR